MGGGGLIPPQEEAPVKGEGAGEARAQGQGHRPWWPVAGLEKGAGKGSHASGISFGHFGGQTMDCPPTSQTGFSLVPFSLQSKERIQKD